MIWPKKDKEREKSEISSERSVESSPITMGSSTPAGAISGSAAVGSSVVKSSEPVAAPSDTINFRVAPSEASLAEEQAARKLGGNIRSVLGEGTTINGRLTFDTPVKIDGKLKGEVFSTKALIVGKSGVIEASIEVDTLIVLGEVSGKVLAKELIEVLPGGRLNADIETRKLAVQDAVFNGACKMKK